ncbi:hypothetical protein AVEN_46916-1 [Araneus ventricosus]|uniref:Uncharacterized protein n=1 Tax=Araneus ventricosus TaxID=182803 RepID=A0A4Y2KQL3_ARAVE|nr:hypothetical protein AVEN_46916-1 [Araneus ventricosus]
MKTYEGGSEGKVTSPLREKVYSRNQRDRQRHCYILHFHILTMVVEAFVPLVHQSIKTGIEEIKVQVAETLNDGFLNFSIGSEMTTCQVLLQRFEEMKITW